MHTSAYLSGWHVNLSHTITKLTRFFTGPVWYLNAVIRQFNAMQNLIAFTRTAFFPRAGGMPAQGLTTLGIWVFLNMADALVTWHSFAVGAAEFNPFLVQLQESAGPAAMLQWKVVLAAAAGIAVWRWGRIQVLRAVNWLIAGVLAYNFAVIGYLIAR